MNDFDEVYMIEHQNEFETMDYGNVEDSENFRYQAIFNGQYSYGDVEANAKEGWIKILVLNPKVQLLSKDVKGIDVVNPYVICVNGELKAVRIKLFGKVIIFKTDPKDDKPMRKNAN